MDPLSDVLSLLKPSGFAAAGFDFGGDWSIQFPERDGIKCHAIVKGEGWLTMDGVEHPVRMVAGDCVLLPKGIPFRCASDLLLTPIDAETFYEGTIDGGMRVLNGGGDVFGFAGNFELEGPYAEMLLDVLPPIVHIKERADKDALRWSIEQMMREMLTPEPGGILILEHLASMILIKALRIYLSDDMNRNVGWLYALADKQLSAAIRGMHSEPAYRWTLEELAAKAGMSRSTFAVKFKDAVGLTPIEYMTRWRMLLASDKLLNSNKTISDIAMSLGYESESSFSTAFKRVMGCSPRRYSNRNNVSIQS